MKLQDQVILKKLPEIFDVIKLPPPQQFPAWLGGDGVFFVSQTSDEYSIMCRRDVVPQALRSGEDWHCFRVDGDILPDQSGIAAGIAKPMADAGHSLILVGTFDRDYVLVEGKLLQTAIEVYEAAGYTVAV